MLRVTRHPGALPLAVAALGALGVLLLLVATGPPAVVCVCSEEMESYPASNGEAQDEAEAREQWQALWQAVAEEGVEALDPKVTTAGAMFAGDTCGMRYRRLYKAVPADAQARLIVAAFANDPASKERLLAPLADASDPAMRARVRVEIARVALRSGRPVDAQAALEGLDRLMIPPACRADVHFLRGRAAIQRGAPHNAVVEFEAATEIDRGFWNAYRDQVPLLVGLLHDSRQSSATCLRRARRLVEVLGALPQLARDTRQFAKLGRSLEQMGVRSSATLLAAGLVWHWTGQAELSRTTLLAAERSPRVLPRICEGEVRDQIRKQLEAQS